MVTKAKKVFINLDELAEGESKTAIELRGRMREYRKAKDLVREMEATLKKDHEELMEEISTTWGADGVVVDSRLEEIIESTSAGKWDKVKLNFILTPKQLEQVYTAGKKYNYIRNQGEKGAERLEI
jgi:hypothetical protein